ncbi:MAG: DUF4870 domain-containing protein [Opitutus sp.]|nr:DUF4870 domain-containing protein [Opitutus sp.]
MTPQSAPASSVPPVNTSDKALTILCHVSALIGVGIVLPFIVWLVKRRDPDAVAAHAAEALNFHLSLLLYGVCLIPLCMIVIGIPLLIIMGLAGVVLAILAAVRASVGMLYRYPLTIRLVK